MREVFIMDLIGKNHSRQEVINMTAEHWKVSPHTALRHYDKTVKKMHEGLKSKATNLAEELIERNNEIYKRCMLEGKYKTAIDANNSIAKVAGLYREKQETTEQRPKIITVREADQSKPKLEIAKAEGED